MRAKQQADAEAMGKPLLGPSSSFAEQKWGDLISQFPEVSGDLTCVAANRIYKRRSSQ